MKISRNKTKRTLFAILCGLMMMFALQFFDSEDAYATTSGTTSDGYEYEIYSDNTACITGYKGSATNNDH